MSPYQGADSDFIVVLLGGFGLFYGSALLRVPRASQRLVAFLALHGGMVRRAAVAGTLWPDASEDHAYVNLRQALARLQRTAGKALAASKLELGLAEGSRLTSATLERSPVGCSTRQ